MSFGKRLRAKRHTGILAVMAIAASLGLSTAAVAPVVESAAPTSQAPREYADTKTAKPRAPETVTNKVKGGGDRNPRRFDSRKARRRWIMAMLGRPNTGRQWVRTRKELRRSDGSFLLSTPAWKLAIMARDRRLPTGRAA